MNSMFTIHDSTFEQYLKSNLAHNFTLLGHLCFWDYLNIEVAFILECDSIFDVIFIFEVVFILEVKFIFEVFLIFVVIFIAEAVSIYG